MPLGKVVEPMLSGMLGSGGAPNALKLVEVQPRDIRIFPVALAWGRRRQSARRHPRPQAAFAKPGRLLFDIRQERYRVTAQPLRELLVDERRILGHGLADRALHLQLDQPVQLDRVLHRQLLDDRLDKAIDDHLGRLDLG